MDAERDTVVVANERAEVAPRLAAVVERLGFAAHLCDVVPRAAGALVDAVAPVAALVAPWPSRLAAAEVTGALAAAECPVVALARSGDRAYARDVAARGAYALSRYDVHDLGAALEIAVRRGRDRKALLAAFERRATIEQAKGLLMARHSVDGDRAFAMLRRHSQRSNRKLVDIAEALVRSHELLQPARRVKAQRPRASL